MVHQSNPEVHRAKLSIPEEITFSVPFQYVDVMKHTRTSIDNASGDTLNDYALRGMDWNDSFPKSRG